jgi:hypothetical protein
MPARNATHSVAGGPARNATHIVASGPARNATHIVAGGPARNTTPIRNALSTAGWHNVSGEPTRLY